MQGIQEIKSIEILFQIESNTISNNKKMDDFGF
jgi:hypothetical protein